MNESMRVDGAEGTIVIRRDGFGIPHVEAASEHDAWFGMGFAAAHDRLWQMEYDRRRAAGRWAEVVGETAVGADTLARRLRLADAAHRDMEAMSPETRAAFEAYAAGVNAFLDSDPDLPEEYALTGVRPEPWEPWHSVAGFKVRHILMGSWQEKLAQAVLLTRVDPETYRSLDVRIPPGSVMALPPGERISTLLEEAGREIEDAAVELGFLSEVEAGSNAWAVHGDRTSTGMPVLCNDSHRALDFPNVYWQVHLSCPAFDVIGATFPGLPGFPHFGHNGAVAWAITHGQADYQDLYIERFDTEHPGLYETENGPIEAERRTERIEVRNGQSREIETWVTRHGPVVHGDPRSGRALSLRYTAIDGPCLGLEVLRPMLHARDVHEMLEAQRQWVDPVNNLLAADTAGNIAYLTRGVLPVRSSEAHRQLPAPGWTGEHEWTGVVPFERMPRSINPPEGFFATANQTIVRNEGLYITYSASPPFRAERIVELLSADARLTPEKLASLQSDVTSVACRLWLEVLREMPSLEGEAETARQLLIGWDGVLTGESGAALLYGFFRRAVVRTLFEPVVGAETWRWLISGVIPDTHSMIRLWATNLLWDAAHNHDEAATARLRGATPEALTDAWQASVTLAGPDPAAWRWAPHHRTATQHTLSVAFPDRADDLNPPRVPMGGDGDCIQAASYSLQESDRFDVTALSVYRQVVDLSDIAHGQYVVPGGASGRTTSPHVADQLSLWSNHERVPMHYRQEDVEATAVQVLTLLGGR